MDFFPNQVVAGPDDDTTVVPGQPKVSGCIHGMEFVLSPFFNGNAIYHRKDSTGQGSGAEMECIAVEVDCLITFQVEVKIATGRMTKEMTEGV